MNSKQRFIVFFASICNALAVVYTVFPLLKDFGYQDANLSKDLLPFWAGRFFPVNSLFVYVSCFSIILIVGGGYLVAATYLAQTKRFSPAFREIALLDGIVSLAALVAIRASSSISDMSWILAGRSVVLVALLGFGCLARVVSRLPKLSTAYEAVSILFCVVCVLLGVGFCVNGPLDYIRGPIFSQTLNYFWPLYGAILCALFVGWLWGMAPLSAKVRSWVTFFALLPIDLYVIRSLAIFTFRNNTAYFDASIIVAPMHDILMGKDIGVNITSTYGFLNIYLFAAFCKLFGVTDYYQGLSYFVSGCFALGYSLIYFLFRYHTKNLVLSLLGIIFVVSTNFNYVHVPIHWLPQCGLFRFGAFIPMLLTLYFIESIRGKAILEWLAASVIAFSMLQLPETGLYALVAMSAIVALRVVFLRDWFFARFLGKICGVLLVFAGIIEIYMFTKHGQGINWLDLMYFQTLYSKYRIAMANFKTIGLWAIVSFVYLVGLYVSFERALSRRVGSRDAAWMFLSAIGPLMMLYFVGKQGLSDLARIQIPAIMLVVVGAHYVLRNFRYKPAVSLVLYGLAAFAVSSSWSANDRGGMKDHWLLTTPVKHAISMPWQERFFRRNEDYKMFLQDVETMKSLVPPDQGLAIMSRMDTLFYVVAERKSVFRNKFYAHFYLESEIKENADLIHESGTKYFFVERSNMQQYDNSVSDHVKNVLNHPGNKFNLVKQLNFIDVYEVVR